MVHVKCAVLLLAVLVLKPGHSHQQSRTDIIISEPRARSVFSRGSNLEIRWSSTAGVHLGSWVQIYLFRGNNMFRTISTKAKNDGEFSWFIPPDFRPYNFYKIGISYTHDDQSLLHSFAYTD